MYVCRYFWKFSCERLFHVPKMVNAFSGKTGSFSKVNIKTLQNQAFTSEANF